MSLPPGCGGPQDPAPFQTTIPSIWLTCAEHSAPHQTWQMLKENEQDKTPPSERYNLIKNVTVNHSSSDYMGQMLCSFTHDFILICITPLGHHYHYSHFMEAHFTEMLG